MNKQIITFLFLIFVSNICHSQIRTITGKVVNALDNSPISDALVTITGAKTQAFTNYLGYFQLEIAQGYNELAIRHASFEDGSIKVPEEDKFQLSLRPAVRKLKALNINSFSSIVDSINYRNENSENYLIANTKYNGGWKRFYSLLANEIMNNKSYDSTDFEVVVEFTINKEGQYEKFKLLPINSINAKIIETSIKNLTAWKPAIQNGKTVAQNFMFTVKQNEEVDSNSDETFSIVDEPSMPKGGYAEFYQFVQKNLRYPAQARRAGVEGKVYVQTVVIEDGTLTEIQVIKGIGGGCDEEVIRVMSLVPAWSPPMQLGEPVKQKIILPITFSLGGYKKFPNSNDIDQTKLISGVNVAAFGIEREKRTMGTSFNKNQPSFTPKISKAYFSAGNQSLEDYIKKNKKKIDSPLPINNQNNNVIVEFTVNKKGEVKNVEVQKGLGKAFDEEAVRLYNNMPRWTPAREMGNPIEKKYTAAINFNQLSNSRIYNATTKFRKGIELLEEKKYAKSIAMITKAIEKNPLHIDYYFTRAMVYFKTNQKEKGCKDLSLIKGRDQEALDFYNQDCK